MLEKPLKLEKMMMPYILACQHPLMHISILSVSCILWFLHPDNTTVKNCNQEKTDFLIGTPTAAYFWMMLNNVINLVMSIVKYLLQSRFETERRKTHYME
jgi:hypothetical protein